MKICGGLKNPTINVYRMNFFGLKNTANNVFMNENFWFRKFNQ
jgi:hypothetical protein